MHLYGSLNGTFHLCCHAEFVSSQKGIGDHTQKPSDVWNGKPMRQVRLDFLKGVIPKECVETCYNLEDSGGTSNRIQVNKRFQDKTYLQSKTKTDGSLDNFPSYIDLRFGNLCNFKCRMCGPYASTSWYKDALTNHSDIIDYYTDNDLLWDDLAQFLPYIEDVYFAGGEPFVQDGHYKLLTTFIEAGVSKNISLQYNTNLSYSKYKKFDLKDMWSNFKTVSLWPSIEGWKHQAEYSRKGLSWDKFVENAQTFEGNITTFSSVISIYSIYSMPELILWFKSINKDFFGTLLQNPSYLSITCLPSESKKLVIEKFKDFIYKYKQDLTDYDIKQMLSWLKYMNSSDTSHLLSEFKQEQQRLDLLRNESFESVYPEYASWYKNI